MKKLLAFSLAVIFAFGGALAAASEKAPAGETYTEGLISVFVPKGWGIYHSDTFKPSVENQVMFKLIKGYSEKDPDSEYNANVSIQYHPTASGLAKLLNDVKITEIAPFTLGAFTWSGRRYVVFGERYYDLCATGDFEGCIRISIDLNEKESKKASETVPQDKDLLAILSSITLAGETEQPEEEKQAPMFTFH